MIKKLLKNIIFTTAAWFCLTGFIQPAFAAGAEPSPEVQKAAASSSFDVFIDDNNDVCIVTNDQKRTSSIYYKKTKCHNLVERDIQNEKNTGVHAT